MLNWHWTTKMTEKSSLTFNFNAALLVGRIRSLSAGTILDFGFWGCVELWTIVGAWRHDYRQKKARPVWFQVSGSLALQVSGSPHCTYSAGPFCYIYSTFKCSRGRVGPSGPWPKTLSGLIRAKTWLSKVFLLCSESKCLVLVKAAKSRGSTESNRDRRVLPPWDDPLMCFSLSLQQNQGQQFSAGLYFCPPSHSFSRAFISRLSCLLCSLFRLWFSKE